MGMTLGFATAVVAYALCQFFNFDLFGLAPPMVHMDVVTGAGKYLALAVAIIVAIYTPIIAVLGTEAGTGLMRLAKRPLLVLYIVAVAGICYLLFGVRPTPAVTDWFDTVMLYAATTSFALGLIALIMAMVIEHAQRRQFA